MCFEIFYYVDFYSCSSLILQEFPEADSTLIKATDSAPVELVITPRKQMPKKDSIYLSLMERLHKTDSLLDFGEVRVQDYGTAMPSSVSDNDFFARRKLQVGEMAPKRRVKGTVRLQRLGSVRSTQLNDEDDETKEDKVEQLLEKLQEANFVASGKKGFANQKQFVFA